MKNVLVFGGSTNSNRDIFIKKINKSDNQQFNFLTIEKLPFTKFGFETLFEAEQYISECVGCILVFLESAGSIAELSTFLHNPNIQNKMIIVIKRSYFDESSFITEAILKHFYTQCKVNKDCDCNKIDVCKDLLLIDSNFDDGKTNRELGYEEIIQKLNSHFNNNHICNVSDKIIEFVDNNYLCDQETIERNFKFLDTNIDKYIRTLCLIGVINSKLIHNRKYFFLSNKENIFQYDVSLNHLRKDYFPIEKSNKYIKLKKNYYIAQPEIKKILNEVKKIFEEEFQPHANSFAYTKRKSILDNAKLHKNNSYLLKLDVFNFFNSISSINFSKTVSSYFSVNENNVLLKDIISLCFINGKLPIGLCTSPILSNIFMYQLDCQLTDYCKSHSIIYSRYSDDMTFSSSIKGKLCDHQNHIISIIENYYDLKINQVKVFFGSKAKQRKITGLVISNENKVSIGRDMKKEIKFYLKLHEKGKMSEQLKGYLQWIYNVDYEFWQSLRNNSRYSDFFY